MPDYEGRKLGEKLMLDGFQAGLSWITILRKRDAFRTAFKGFDPEKVARFQDRDVLRLLGNPGIVRSRAKIAATIGGARAYLAMRDRGEEFSSFVWTIFARLNEEGRTVVLITHEPDVAEQAKRVIRLSDGQVLEDRRTLGVHDTPPVLRHQKSAHPHDGAPAPAATAGRVRPASMAQPATEGQP